MKKIILSFLFVFCSLYIIAQENSTTNVVAHIVDEKGDPVPFASIGIIENNRFLSTGAETDFGGIFDVDMSPNHQLQVSAIGYETVKLSFDKIIEEDLVTLSSKIYDLEEIVITAIGNAPRYRCTCCNYHCLSVDEQKVEKRKKPTDYYDWTYYPNPTFGEVSIETENKEGLIVVYSLAGERLQNISINSSRVEVNLKDLPSSTYLLTYEADGKTESIGKVIKLKD